MFDIWSWSCTWLAKAGLYINLYKLYCQEHENYEKSISTRKKSIRHVSMFVQDSCARCQKSNSCTKTPELLLLDHTFTSRLWGTQNCVCNVCESIHVCAVISTKNMIRSFYGSSSVLLYIFNVLFHCYAEKPEIMACQKASNI